MAYSKVPKSRLGPLGIVDADVDSISPSKLSQGGAVTNQVLMWGGTAWEPMTLPSYVTFVDDETPTGTKNGSNVTFGLAGTPNPTSSLQLFVGGILMTQGTADDYTLAGTVITFAVAPGVNDTLKAYYRK